MPNWCSCTLIVGGTAGEVYQFMNDFIGLPVDWDNKTQEVSKADLISQYGSIFPPRDPEKYYMSECFNAIIPVPQDIIDIGFDAMPTHIGQDAFFSYMNGEPSDGYTWCCRNWGCKWDIHGDVQVTGNIEIERLIANDDVDPYAEVHYNFETAWSPPIPFLKTIGKKYPDLRFEFEYAEPMNCFAGEIEIEDGNVISNFDYQGNEAIDYMRGLGYEFDEEDEQYEETQGNS